MLESFSRPRASRRTLTFWPLWPLFSILNESKGRARVMNQVAARMAGGSGWLTGCMSPEWRADMGASPYLLGSKKTRRWQPWNWASQNILLSPSSWCTETQITNPKRPFSVEPDQKLIFRQPLREAEGGEKTQKTLIFYKLKNSTLQCWVSDTQKSDINCPEQRHLPLDPFRRWKNLDTSW